MRLILFVFSWIACAGSALAADTAAAVDELLRPGDPSLQTSHLQPFEARYRQVVAGEDSQEGGERVHRLDVMHAEGRELLRQTVTMLGEGVVEDETVATRDGMHNVLRRIAAPSMLYRVEVWDQTTVHGVNVTKDGRRAETFTVEADGQRFAAVPSLVLASLPLREGGQYLLASFSTDFGVGSADLVSRVAVLARESFETAAGPFRAWKVAVDLFRPAEGEGALGEPLGLPTHYLWVSDRPPYVVRSEFQSPGGPAVLELVAVQAGGCESP